MSELRQRGTVANTGEPIERINEITGELDAAAWYNVTGFDYGVFKGKFGEFAGSAITRGINIKAGAGIAYGYRAFLGRAVDFTFTQPTGSDKYYFIYAEWDFRQDVPEFAVDYWDNGNSSAWIPRQDNLSTNPKGLFLMPLYMMRLTNTEAVTLTDLRLKVDGVQKINGINLKNEFAVLKADDYIVEKKQLIFDTPMRIETSGNINVTQTILDTDIIEIYAYIEDGEYLTSVIQRFTNLNSEWNTFTRSIRMRTVGGELIHSVRGRIARKSNTTLFIEAATSPGVTGFIIPIIINKIYKIYT